MAKYSYPTQLNIGNFVLIKLAQNNYLLWKTQMHGLIESQDLAGFIEGDYPKPEKYNLSDDGKTESLNPEFF